MRRRIGGRGGGGERCRKAGGVGGTAFQAGRTEGDCGAESGVEYTDRVAVESGVEGWNCGSSSVRQAAGVEGGEVIGEREQKDKPKGERRVDLGGEGGWRGDTRERDIGGKRKERRGRERG